MGLLIPGTNLFKSRNLRKRDLLCVNGAELLCGSNAQPDQAQFAGERAQEKLQDFRRLPLAQAALNQDNIPTQLRYTPYFVLITRVSNPQLLLPSNPARCSYILSGTPGSTALQFSFGYPIPIPGNQFLGMQLPPGENFQEANGSCSIDNIWVWSNDDKDVEFAFIGYEGVLAVESLQHKPARGLSGG